MFVDSRYARLPERFFARTPLTPWPAGKMLVFNTLLAQELGLSEDAADRLGATLTGKEPCDQAALIAMAYAGHQFGHFVPQLGDGRALLFGELCHPDGHRVDVHLKGSGPTAFSRGGDGFAALGPVLREYVVSEAMHHLGVPTTRSLLALRTGENVLREGMLAGGLLARVARSHVRVGTFEYFAARGDEEGLERLVDFVMEREGLRADDLQEATLVLFEATVDRMARLVAHWMSLGFIHGVMNTDNTSLSGETIDYGPCAFMDEFLPNQVFSSIDRHGRYAYDQQATIAQWNCARLADCLSLLHGRRGIQEVPDFVRIVDTFPQRYLAAWRQRMRPKLGLLDAPRADDDDLLRAWLTAMEKEQWDFTASFRRLPAMLEDESDHPPLVGLFVERWRRRLSEQERPTAELAAAMDAVNPRYIPRNHLVEEAIRNAYQGDDSVFHKLNDVLSRPFEDQQLAATYSAPQVGDIRVSRTFCGT